MSAPRLVVEALEPRLLHSADFTPLALAGGVEQALHASLAAPAALAAPRTEIVFVDESLQDTAALRADLEAQRAAGRSLEIVGFDGDDDALALISRTLAGRQDVAAVHVLSHGSEGALAMGSVRLDAETLLARAAEVAGWRDALADDADLLLYGCDLAAGDAGRALVADLAALTGADVAASTDATGGAAGDWQLEYAHGNVNSVIAPSATMQQSWRETLAINVDGVNSSKSSGAVTSFGWSHSVGSGSDRLLVVQLAMDRTAGASTITYNGQALTRLGDSDHVAEGVSAEIWYLINPVADSGTVQVNFGAATRIVGGSVSFTGVDQTTPFGTPVATTGGGSSPSATVAAAGGDMVIGIAAAKAVEDWEGGSGQVHLWADSQGNNANDIGGAASREPGAASVTLTEPFADDGSGRWAMVAVAIQRTGTGNQPPVIDGGDSAAISVAENTAAVGTVSATDPEGQSLTYAIVGGTDQARFAIDAASGALRFVTSPDHETPADADGDNVYHVVVRASDASLSDTQAIAVTVTNVNEVPSGVPVIAGTVREGQWLNVDTSSIADVDGLGTFAFQWLRNGQAIDGATGERYQLEEEDVGHTIRVRVAWTDGQGHAEALTSMATAPVENFNAAPTGSVTLHGPALEDATLTADTSTVADSDGLGSFGYHWMRNGVVIAGANGASHTLGDPDVGARISVRVVYVDGQGSAESLTSAPTVPVANVNDVPTGLPIVTGPAVEDATLLADTTSIGDADGLGAFSFQWLRNGTAIAGATGASLTLGDADVGARISVRVTWTDGHGHAEALTSAPTSPVANVNDAPLATATLTAPQATAGAPWQLALPPDLFVDPDPGDALVLRFERADGSPAPPWLTLDSDRIHGTPGAGHAGLLHLRLVATDAAGASAAVSFDLTVADAPVAPPPPPPPPPEPPPAEAAPPAPQSAPPAPEPAPVPPPVALAPATTVPAPAPGAPTPAPVPVALPAAPSLTSAVVIDDAPAARTFAAPASAEHRPATRADTVLAPALLAQLAMLDQPSQATAWFGAEADLMRRFEERQRQLRADGQAQAMAVTSGIAITGGISVGYVVWLVRGGVLMSSMLSTLPAWRLIDPLPVLAAARRATQGQEAAADDVERLFDKSGRRVPAPPATAATPLPLPPTAATAAPAPAPETTEDAR